MYLHITKQENNQRYKKCKIKELKDSILINKENEKIKKKQKRQLKDFIIHKRFQINFITRLLDNYWSHGQLLYTSGEREESKCKIFNHPKSESVQIKCGLRDRT
jgi:hypothetical protein